MEDKKIVIGLVGQIACGKGVVKKYLIEKYNASDYRFSTILRDVLDRLNIEVSRENLSSLSTSLRQSFGEGLLAEAMKEDVSNDEHKVIIIDGIRRMTDMEHLKTLGNFHLISVKVDDKIRYDRVVSRNENAGDADKTYEEFDQDQKAEPEKEIPEVMSKADFEVVNEGTLDELYEQIEKILAEIKNKV